MFFKSHQLNITSIILFLSFFITAATTSTIVFERSPFFAAIQVQFTTSSGFISEDTVKTFSIVNQGYANISSLGLALCGYDLPTPTSMQYRADASHKIQQNVFIVTISPFNKTQFVFINYYLLITTNDAISYLYIHNTCLKPSYNFTNPNLFNTLQSHTISMPYTSNDTNKITPMVFLRSINNIVVDNFNFFKFSNISIQKNTALMNISILVNYGFQAEVCFSILFYHDTEGQTNKFMNVTYSNSITIIDSDNPAQSLGTRSQQSFMLSSIYGPNFNYKCIIGFQAFKMRSSFRQTINFNMTGSTIYGLISSGSYQIEYSWFCLASIFCQGVNVQYYPYSNSCQEVCNITNCGICQTSTSCRKCDNQYYINQLYRCSKCISNCLNCSNSTNCFACVSGYYYNGSSCLICSQHCLECDANSCKKCLVGYYIQSNNCAQCSLVQPSCLQCLHGYTCNLCPEGFYNTFSSGCRACSSSMQSCIFCGSASICNKCVQGYYLSPVSRSVCLRCTFDISAECCSSYIKNCLNCTSATICSRCLGGYFLDSNTRGCSSCNLYLLNCSSCLNQSYCQSCQTGYYIDSLRSCKPCSWSINNCISCSNQTYCLKCNTNYLIIDGSCYNCPIWPLNDLFYLDNNKNCIQCRVLVPYCIKCSNSSCFQCNRISFYLNNKCILCQSRIVNCISCRNDLLCQICRSGYYPDNQNPSSCISCQSSIQNCLSCIKTSYSTASSFTLSCNICRPQYYVQNSKCLPCSAVIQFCLTCLNSFQCATCQKSYFLSSTLVCVRCEEIIQGCIGCNSSSICTNCSQGYYLINNYCTLCRVGINNCYSCGVYNNSLVCSSCSQGYFISYNFQCIACNKTIQYCASCSSSSSCIKCIPGFLVNFNKICSPCKAIIANCQYCTNKCLKCLDGFLINPLAQCINCSTFYTGCNLCYQSNPGNVSCSSCLAGYIGFNSSGTFKCIQCLSTILNCQTCLNLTVCMKCQDGYFLNPKSQCSLCSLYLPNCINCNSSSACTICRNKYYLNENKSCQTCNTSQFGSDGSILNKQVCLYCQYRSNIAVCMSCISGYYIGSNKCLSCSSIANCIECSSINICITCKPGFYLSQNNNLCIQCSATLVYCHKCNSIGICLQCNSQSFLNSSLNRCILCSTLIFGCRSCINNSCIVCQDGYYKEGSSCIACSTSIKDCALCSNPTNCLLFSNQNINQDKNESKSFINDMEHSAWMYVAIVGLVLLLLTLAILLIRYCCCKNEDKKQEKTVQNMTKLHSQRQFVSQQNNNKVQINNTQYCHACKTQKIQLMNVQILCSQCQKQQKRGNQHFIRRLIGAQKSDVQKLKNKVQRTQIVSEKRQKKGKSKKINKNKDVQNKST